MKAEQCYVWVSQLPAQISSQASLHLNCKCVRMNAVIFPMWEKSLLAGFNMANFDLPLCDTVSWVYLWPVCENYTMRHVVSACIRITGTHIRIYSAAVGFMSRFKVQGCHHQRRAIYTWCLGYSFFYSKVEVITALYLSLHIQILKTFS